MFSEKLGINYNISGNGKPIVLLNGIMMSVPSWAEHVKYLEKDFQVITYDMKDQGKSRYVDYQYDISMHVQDLRDLLTE
ncbi:MAG TPA: alpha/beta hydrolase, partial [Petrotogaceae bacterium]|nr:alpha/beta hydrolase [Petrotogaceae bacterium]